MRISLNDTVEFSLTEYGAEVWNNHYADFPSLQKRPGPMTEQLWEVMQVLGRTMYNGAPKNAIESNAIETRSDSADQRLAAETKLAAYTEAFARAQRTLLDLGHALGMMRRLVVGERIPDGRTLTNADIDAMVTACSLAAMHPGVVKHSGTRMVGLTFDTGGSSFSDALGEAIEAAQGGREFVYIEHGGSRMQVRAQDTVESATARWMDDVLGKKPSIDYATRRTENGLLWSVGAGRLSVELHALTDLLALARAVGAEVGTFTVHELARIAGDLHASSYVEHSIALNQIHALLNNMPETSLPMLGGATEATRSTVERVRILVDVLRKATDAILAGGAS